MDTPAAATNASEVPPSASGDSSQEQSTNQQQAPHATALQDLVAGGIAGSASVVVGHPFDTYKVRLQTSKPGCASAQSFGGFSSLFRGMAAPLSTAAVVNAMIFSAFGESSRLWDEKVLHKRSEQMPGLEDVALPNQHDSFAKSLVCGSFAGFVQCFVLCPMEHIKCRLQVQHGRGAADNLYRGPFDAVDKIVEQHGIRGLYRGWWSTCLREIPAFALYFATYDHIKDRVNGMVDEWYAEKEGEASAAHTWAASAFAGGVSGSLTWIIIYPVDIIKSRIQTSSFDTPKSELRMVNVARTIVRENGWRFMFRGLGVTLARAFPVNGVIFPVYEFTLSHLVSSGIFGRKTDE